MKITKAVKRTFFPFFGQYTEDVLNRFGMFEDVNNLLKCKNFIRLLDTLDNSMVFSIVSFVTGMINERGENAVANMLAAENPYHLCEAIEVLSERVRPDSVIYTFLQKNCRNFAEMRETAFRVRGKDNISLPVEPDVVIGEYEFHFPVDSYELATVGAEMGICVGSYDVAVSEGCTHVVVMRERGSEKPLCCIEYNDGVLEQCKAKFNNPAKEEWREAIIAFCVRMGLDYLSCEDYQSIGNEWTSQDRYDRINPEQIYREGGKSLKVVRCDKVLIDQEHYDELIDNASVYGHI